MKKCAECGYSSNFNTKYCLCCGAKLEESESSVTPKKCPQCGVDLVAVGKYCASCGAEIEKSNTLESPIYFQQEESILTKKFSGVKLLGVVLILIGISVIYYFSSVFQVTVTTQPIPFMGQEIGGGQHINNIGLMADRQNGLIGGYASIIVGVLLFLFGDRK